MTTGLLDTSVFIAEEVSRERDVQRLPESVAVSVVTIGELWAGALAATNVSDRRLRMRTLAGAQRLAALPIDADVARAWAELRVWLRDERRSLGVNDSWIAATAMAHGAALVTQDADFDGIDGLDVIKI